MANCVKEFFRNNGTSFTETRGVVVAVKITDEITWDFYSSNKFVAFDGGVPYIVGKWQCDGRVNFTITGDVTKKDGTKKTQTYSSKTPDKWTDTVQTAQLDSFTCVTNALSQYIILSNIDGVNFQIKDNLYVVAAVTPEINWFFYQPKQGTKTWVEVSNKTITSQGTWECFGQDKFKITRSDGKTYTAGKQEWEEPTTPEATTEGNPIFNCIRNKWADEETVKFTELPDRLTLISSAGGGYRVVYYTNGRFAYFENNSDGKEEFIGKGDWKCKGERDYEWRYDDDKLNIPEVFPWTEPEQTTEPEANDSFPLKLGSKGPNVVKLQKFLNDKIPGNPLTVNGVFDQKTADKVIEFQKKEGIIK